MNVEIATNEQEFLKWFPEIDPKIFSNFKIRSIVIELEQAFRFEFNPLAPRTGVVRVHVNWSGDSYETMRAKLFPIIRASMYGNFADTYVKDHDDLRKMMHEIKELYPNTTLLKGIDPCYEYRIDVRG